MRSARFSFIFDNYTIMTVFCSFICLLTPQSTSQLYYDIRNKQMTSDQTVSPLKIDLG